MAVDPRAQVEQRLQRLGEFHSEDLPPRQALVLVLQAAGCTDAEVAEAMTTSLHTVRNQARLARAKVTPPDVAESRGTAVAWVWLHRECCVAGPWAQVTGDVQEPVAVAVRRHERRVSARSVGRTRENRALRCPDRKAAKRWVFAVVTPALGIIAMLAIAAQVLDSGPSDVDDGAVVQGDGRPAVHQQTATARMYVEPGATPSRGSTGWFTVPVTVTSSPEPEKTTDIEPADRPLSMSFREQLQA
jgi:hypothetical protein